MREPFKKLLQQIETLKETGDHALALHLLLFLASIVQRKDVNKTLQQVDLSFLYQAIELAKKDSSLTVESFERYCMTVIKSAHIGCDLVLMSNKIEENHGLAEEGKLYLKSDGNYISRFKGKVFSGSLFSGKFGNAMIDMSGLNKKLLESDFKKEVLSITSKRSHTPHICQLSDFGAQVTQFYFEKKSALTSSLLFQTYQSMVENPNLLTLYKEKLTLFSGQLSGWVIERWSDHNVMPKNHLALTTLQRQHLQQLIQPYLSARFHEEIDKASETSMVAIQAAISLWEQEKKIWKQVLLLPVLFNSLERRLKALTDSENIKKLGMEPAQNASVVVLDFLFQLPIDYAAIVVEGVSLLSPTLFQYLSLEKISHYCAKLLFYVTAEKIPMDTLLAKDWTEEVCWFAGYQKLNQAREIYYETLKQKNLTALPLSEAQRHYSQSVGNILQYFWNITLDLLGDGPDEMALVVVGSSGRADMSLYC